MNIAHSFTVQVAGTPRSQPRPRGRAIMPKHGGKPFVHVYNPDTSREWKKALISHVTPKIHGRRPWDQAVRVTIVAFFERPAWMRVPALECLTDLPYLGTPDRDNIDKAVLDALTVARVWEDDCLVFSGPTEKYYAEPGYRDGVHVTVELLELHPDYFRVRAAHLAHLEQNRLKKKPSGAALFAGRETRTARTPKGRLTSRDARAMGLDIQEQS